MPWRTNPHETEHIAVKTAEVDTEMVTIVKWLNSFPWISTITCCQGEEDENILPYVTFWSYMDADFIRVAERLGHYGTLAIEVKDAQVRYYMRFKSQDSRNQLTNSLQRDHEKAEETE
jgi:hypothetical protein